MATARDATMGAPPMCMADQVIVPLEGDTLGAEAAVHLDHLYGLYDGEAATPVGLTEFAEAHGLIVRPADLPDACRGTALYFVECPTDLLDLQRRRRDLSAAADNPFHAVVVGAVVDDRTSTELMTDEVIVRFEEDVPEATIEDALRDADAVTLETSPYAPHRRLVRANGFVLSVSDHLDASQLTRYAHPNGHLCVEDR